MVTDLARLLRAHDDFIETGEVPPELRPLVADSWLRSVRAGIDPERDLAPILLDAATLEQIRLAHPLAPGLPVIRRLLVEAATDAGLLVAVSDAAGQLLWVEGSHSMRSRAESMNFLPGADWSEAGAGTNAPGTALALDRPVALLGPEHLARPVTPWSCSAAPIHDPDTGAVLGVLDLTGGVEVAETTSLALVRATAAAVESELRVERLRGPATRTLVGGWTPDVVTINVLGARGAVVEYGATTSRLSLRHSEIVALLAHAERGLTSAEIAVALSEDELSDVTIRAEFSRLRTALGAVGLESRPYRFAQRVRLDVDEVRDALAAGQVRSAVAAYLGPLLPDSSAPAVVEMRDELHSLVRSHLLASADADALLSFADTVHGNEDLEIWERIARILPLESPRSAQVMDHLARLDDALG